LFYRRLVYHSSIKKVGLYTLSGLAICIILFLPGTTETHRFENSPDLQIKRIIEKVSSQNIQNTIAHLQSFGNRSTWEKQWGAADWVCGEFKKIGLEVNVHRYEFNGEIWPNVIATIKGKERPEEIVMLIAHVDSISDTSETIAPGADDNSSGVAVLLESARILKEISMDRSVFFGVFTNEEHGRQGSKSYAHLAKTSGLNIKAVINLDILGYNRPTWPFYWGAVMGHKTLKHKAKAIFRMARNYVYGAINGKDIVKVAGREPNRNLAMTTSHILGQSSGLKVKQTVRNDCG
jgi:Zn-dependent M28 family amino/carboxypeptidase